PDIAFGSARVGDALVRHAVSVEVFLDPGDQRQVRVAAGRVEPDQGIENLDRPLDFRHDAVCSPGALGNRPWPHSSKSSLRWRRLAGSPAPVRKKTSKS